MRHVLWIAIVAVYYPGSLCGAAWLYVDSRESKLKDSVKAFFDAVAKEDYVAASKDFDEAVRKASPPDKLKELFQTLNKQLGALKKQGDPRLEKVGDRRLQSVMAVASLETGVGCELTPTL